MKRYQDEVVVTLENGPAIVGGSCYGAALRGWSKMPFLGMDLVDIDVRTTLLAGSPGNAPPILSKRH